MQQGGSFEIGWVASTATHSLSHLDHMYVDFVEVFLLSHEKIYLLAGDGFS